MKKIFPILLLAITFSALSLSTSTLNAQIKKTTTTKKTIVPAKKATTPKVVATSKPATAASNDNPKSTASTSSAKTINKAANNSSAYNTALGIKLLYGISLTAKHFIKENSALEGIFNYRGLGGIGTQLGVTVLYEYQRPIADVPNLQWYLGGGAHFQYLSYDDGNVDPITIFGATGVLGLEYKFSGLPIAISADWQPIFTFNEGGGFGAENGGIGLKYTF